MVLHIKERDYLSVYALYLMVLSRFKFYRQKNVGLIVTSSAIDKMFEIFGPIFEQNVTINFEPIFEQNANFDPI